MTFDAPDDLTPLPSTPWDERPESLPLDVEECRTAIWRCGGNITEAAQLLKVPSLRLRRFVKASPRLTAEVNEASEMLVDMAENVVADALSDPERADAMARFVLQSKGKSRGWGTGGGPNVSVKSSGPLHITWGGGLSMDMEDEDEPRDVTPQSKVIDA